MEEPCRPLHWIVQEIGSFKKAQEGRVTSGWYNRSLSLSSNSKAWIGTGTCSLLDQMCG